MMYWKIGERIFEEEQKGEEKAEYMVQALLLNLQKGKRGLFMDFKAGIKGCNG